MFVLDGMPILADAGYDGAGIGVRILVRHPTDGNVLDVNTCNMLLRCLGERGFALLTQRWRTLQHITTSPSKIGNIVRAALVLTQFEPCRLI
ncbi:transposase family protein [Streptosporangium sp. DT93]|uniref:transposase family protein n=1 Tax=Streptosporangium sp. DT93 TaxID=3393428 RepID=UPI003CF4D39B